MPCSVDPALQIGKIIGHLRVPGILRIQHLNLLISLSVLLPQVFPVLLQCETLAVLRIGEFRTEGIFHSLLSVLSRLRLPRRSRALVLTRRRNRLRSHGSLLRMIRSRWEQGRGSSWGRWGGVWPLCRRGDRNQGREPKGSQDRTHLFPHHRSILARFGGSQPRRSERSRPIVVT